MFEGLHPRPVKKKGPAFAGPSLGRKIMKKHMTFLVTTQIVT